jgi:DNA mismatch repair protein MutL
MWGAVGCIHRLPEALVNQIAAGEVVERPASVVKELAENAIDAGASTVRVCVGGGGLDLLSVTDDGVGMSPGDARLSLERHATSKLLDAQGLTRILTKGFRGEALPAIASVSRFSLLTSTPEAAMGTRLSTEGGASIEVEPCAPLGGTRVEVRDLFFNTPARRKYLKRDSTELGHCEDAVHRLALAHPEVGFFLDHDGRSVFSSPAAPDDPKERVAAVLGAQAAPHLLGVEERRLGVTVTGFVASPEYTLPTARGLMTFVNRRYIRDRGLNAAVQRAFQDSLPPGRQPVVAVFIDVPPETVDVNVHPQKLEVRFSDPREVQLALNAGISRALRAAPWRTADPGPTGHDAQAHYAQAVDRFLARAQPTSAALEAAPLPIAADSPVSTAFGTARPDINAAPPKGYFGALRFLADLARRFWLCEGPGGTLVILDPAAVVERVTLQALVGAMEDGLLEAASETLFSASVALPADVASRLLAAAPSLARLGIVLEAFGADSVVVRGLPAALESAEPRALLLDLASTLSCGAPPPPMSTLALMATHAAAGRSGTQDEVRRLLSRLDACDFSLRCLGGRVVLMELPLLDLEARAGSPRR